MLSSKEGNVISYVQLMVNCWFGIRIGAPTQGCQSLSFSGILSESKPPTNPNNQAKPLADISTPYEQTKKGNTLVVLQPPFSLARPGGLAKLHVSSMGKEPWELGMGRLLIIKNYTLGIQSPCQKMIGVYNRLLSKVFRFHDHSHQVIGSLGINNYQTGIRSGFGYLHLQYLHSN